MKNENKDLKRFTIYIYVQLASAILFSLVSLSFHGDISLLAFPVSVAFTAITVWFVYFKMLRKTDGSKGYGALKLVQYLPIVDFLAFILRRAGKTGTAMWYDIISVVLWIVIFYCSLILSSYMSDKRFPTFTDSWSVKPKKIKLHGGKRVAFEVVDWIDALVQAVFMVLLIQIFLLQLYVIPSESMVPNLVVKDRVAVSKVNCGPKFPLTNIGFADVAKYKRGEIVVLRNPHYKMDRKSEVKTVTSQLVYMLTIMAVDLNKDEDGNPKYDPLVKRICGEPGEQLVMQDGTLYRRTKNNDVFTPVAEDNKYACWDLTAVNKDILPKVQYFPLAIVQQHNDRKGNLMNLKQVLPSAKTQYQNMLDFEEERRNLDLDVTEFQVQELCIKMNELVAKYGSKKGTFKAPSLSEYDLFRDVSEIASNILSKEGGSEWFTDFMTSWIPAKKTARDMYAEANYRLNIMCKLYFGNLAVRYAELMCKGFDASLGEDNVLTDNMNNAALIDWYIRGLLDVRNMPVFPADDENGNPQYIPENCYFMMGDNRFNSHDLRHANDYEQVPLTKADSMSVEYDSLMAPQYVHRKLIIGKPMFRFWPLDRPMKLNQ